MQNAFLAVPNAGFPQTFPFTTLEAFGVIQTAGQTMTVMTLILSVLLCLDDCKVEAAQGETAQQRPECVQLQSRVGIFASSDAKVAELKKTLRGKKTLLSAMK